MALLAVMIRRWWTTATAAALLTAGAIVWMHAADLQRSDLQQGQTRDLTVRFTSPARHHDGVSGPWWTAHGRIVAGARDLPVGLSGSGAAEYQVGDRITGVMLVAAPDSRGEAARLRVRGTPQIQPDDSWSATIRATMRAVAGDDDPGWLLSGMTLGMDEGMSAAAADNMRAAGLTHLTAVSGANCAVLVVLTLWLGGFLRIPRTARMVSAAVILLGFVVVVGPAPSVLRASAMAFLGLIAALVGGRRAAVHVLQVSAWLLLLADPWLAYSVGFMLSIAATAGLIALLDRGPLAATVAAQIATFPILLAIGASVGLRSVLSNVLATPLAAVIPVVGLGSLAAQALAGLGAPVAAAGRVLTRAVLWLAAAPVPDLVTWLPGAAGVGLAALVAAAVFTIGRRRLVLVAVLLISIVSLTVRLGERWPPDDWWLVACDVGQGDGLVIRAGTGVIVVDTGPDPDLMDGCLSRLGVRSIDLLVISHFHADHVDGIAGAVRGRSVGQVWVSPCTEPQQEHRQALSVLGDLPVSVPGAGSVHQIGDTYVQVVSVQRVVSAGSVPNNSSLAFMLVAPQGRLVAFADLEAQAQAMVLRTAHLTADVVKVPHHGSANFDPRLPAAVRAQFALISVGEDNTYGHPAPEALAAWQSAGAAVYTTMDNGDIAVTRGRQVVVRGVSRRPTR